MTLRYDVTLPVSERKRHGVYYTPEPVVRYLLRATAPTGAVADLSCGDGAFLLEAAHAEHRVMGIDRDATALDHAAERLAMIPAERWHLQCADGLAPHFPETPDVVLGNPPYLEAKKADPALKAHCRALFPDVARGGFDAFICFIKAGLDLLPPGGRLGYIVPNKLLIAEYARPLREWLLRETTILELIDVSDISAFRDAAVYPILLVVRKSSPPAQHQVRTGTVSDVQQLETGDFPVTFLPQARWTSTARRVFWLPPQEASAHALVERLMADPSARPFSSCLDIRWTVSFHRAGLRDEFIFPEATGRVPYRLLGGKRFHGNADVRRYRTAWSGWWIDYDEARAKLLHNQLPPLSLFTAPKILIAQNAKRITATLDTEGFVCKDTFLLGRPHADLSLEYLLGVLNSSLMSYLYGILFNATHVGGAYLHYLACYLEDLPLRIADDPTPVEALVRAILTPNLPEHARQDYDAQLDELIFELYQLTPAERQLVRAAVPYSLGEGAMRRGQWDARQSLAPPL
ncbi:MAG TPA: TaqI-like C-terminal specificity domain-containing protein [Armatimonadota bacterium]|jgi:SAM-dependent methyltransferase